MKLKDYAEPDRRGANLTANHKENLKRPIGRWWQILNLQNDLFHTKPLPTN